MSLIPELAYLSMASCRGTIDLNDILADLTAKPILHKFSSELTGFVHAGMLKCAQYVITTVWEALNAALDEEPDFAVLLTGEVFHLSAGFIQLMHSLQAIQWGAALLPSVPFCSEQTHGFTEVRAQKSEPSVLRPPL